MNVKKTALLAMAGLTMAFTAASDASAEPGWYHSHPRQAEVLGRVAHQDHRIFTERREGELTGWQARRLHREDRRIAMQDRRDARINGGFITKGEQHQLNREENRASRQIGR